MTEPLTTPVTGSMPAMVGLLVGGVLTASNDATATTTVALLESPRRPISPKLSRWTSPARPWRAKPLAASLTVTSNESVTPVRATLGAGT